jgi:hypothetical protein
MRVAKQVSAVIEWVGLTQTGRLAGEEEDEDGKN